MICACCGWDGFGTILVSFLRNLCDILGSFWYPWGVIWRFAVASAFAHRETCLRARTLLLLLWWRRRPRRPTRRRKTRCSGCPRSSSTSSPTRSCTSTCRVLCASGRPPRHFAGGWRRCGRRRRRGGCGGWRR